MAVVDQTMFILGVEGKSIQQVCVTHENKKQKTSELN